MSYNLHKNVRKCCDYVFKYSYFMHSFFTKKIEHWKLKYCIHHNLEMLQKWSFTATHVFWFLFVTLFKSLGHPNMGIIIGKKYVMFKLINLWQRFLVFKRTKMTEKYLIFWHMTAGIIKRFKPLFYIISYFYK